MMRIILAHLRKNMNTSAPRFTKELHGSFYRRVFRQLAVVSVVSRRRNGHGETLAKAPRHNALVICKS